MKTLIELLPEQLHADLNHIRSCIEVIGARYQGADNDHLFDPMAWADQSLALLDTWLLDEEQRQMLRLNPWDVFLLCASVYLCGIGLADIAGPSDHTQNNPSVLASVNGHRHKPILEIWKNLGIRNVSVAAAIADIRKNVALHDVLPNGSPVEGEHVFGGTTINRSLLSAAVELSQALNLKNPVTAAQVCGFLRSSTTPSYEKYKNAVSVTRVGPHPHRVGTIQMKIQCRDPELHRALKHHERSVQRRLHHINRNASPRFLYSDVIYEIEAEGYAPVDMKFAVDTSAALQLLTGNRLYSDNRVFLRELIQNAVDACNLRKRLGSHYDPSISIRFNDDISIVTVRDNGIGMDRQWIEKYFLTIGISLYQSSEVHSASRRSRIDLSFISQFGIGFLSSFLVADKIVIKTRKAQSPGLMITISDLRDYFDVRSINGAFAVGTEVALHLKPSKINYSRSWEYAGYLKTNIRFLDVPVVLQDQDGRMTTIGRDKLSYERPETADIDFIAPLELNGSEGYVLLRAKKNGDHFFAVETAKGGVSVFQDGIFVTQVDTLLPEGARQNVIGRINLRGEGKCALSLDRNRIFWTDSQLLEIKQAIRMGIAAATNQFLAAVESQDVARGTRQSMINNLSIFFDFNDVDDAVYKRLCGPVRKVVEKRFRDFVRIHFAHTLRKEGIPEADGYHQFWQQRIVDSFIKN